MPQIGDILAVASLALMSMLVIGARRRMSGSAEDRRRRERDRLRELAGQLKLELVEGREDLGDSLAGWIDGFYVDVALGPFNASGGAPDQVRIRIDSEGKIPSDLSIAPRGNLESLASLPSPSPFKPAQEIQAGSDLFQARVSVRGHELSARTVLDEDTRRTVLNVVGRLGVSVEQGVLRWETLDDVRVPIAVIVTRMIELGSALAHDPESSARRLRKSALEDEVPLVRRRCLALLFERYAGSQEARSACEDALRDGDPAVRLFAAKHFGERGRPVVRELAGTDTVPYDTRVEALRHLARITPAECVEPLLAAFRSRSRRVQGAALALSMELDRGLIPVDRLLNAIAECPSFRPAIAEATTAAAIARALGRTGEVRAEPLLIALLAREELTIKVAAASALGMIGSARAVEPLLVYTKGVLLDSYLKTTARAAIGDIQARLGDAEGGQLSMIDDSDESAGALSVSPDEGALSLSPGAKFSGRG